LIAWCATVSFSCPTISRAFASNTGCRFQADHSHQGGGADGDKAGKGVDGNSDRAHGLCDEMRETYHLERPFFVWRLRETRPGLSWRLQGDMPLLKKEKCNAKIFFMKCNKLLKKV
jgi:hypothetical protein